MLLLLLLNDIFDALLFDLNGLKTFAWLLLFVLNKSFVLFEYKFVENVLLEFDEDKNGFVSIFN